MMFTYQLNDEMSLGLFEPHHAEELFALINENRAYLREWMAWIDGTQYTVDVLGFIKSARQQFADNNGFQAGIWYRGQVAGVVGFHTIDWVNRKTEIGYWLGAQFQGKGLMTRAVAALTDYAFKTLKLNRVGISCAPENRRSRAIPERLGFTNEGVTCQVEWLYDHFVDHVMYGMLAADWHDNHQPTNDNIVESSS
jgi:ribosomal-protein-serine acetyltransferase